MSSAEIEQDIDEQLSHIKLVGGTVTYELCYFAYNLVKLICATINESTEEHE